MLTSLTPGDPFAEFPADRLAVTVAEYAHLNTLARLHALGCALRPANLDGRQTIGLVLDLAEAAAANLNTAGLRDLLTVVLAAVELGGDLAATAKALTAGTGGGTR